MLQVIKRIYSPLLQITVKIYGQINLNEKNRFSLTISIFQIPALMKYMTPMKVALIVADRVEFLVVSILDYYMQDFDS